MQKILLLLICIFSLPSLSAQNAERERIILSGHVYDEYFEPVIACTIRKTAKDPITGTFDVTTGATGTNYDGYYEIACYIGDTISLSWVGYRSFTWVVDNYHQDFYTQVNYDWSNCFECDLITESMLPSFITTRPKKAKTRRDDYKRKGFAILFPHTIRTDGTFGTDRNNFGASATYMYALGNIIWRGPDFVHDYFLKYSNVSATYAKPNWKDDDLVYAQYEMGAVLPFIRAGKHGMYYPCALYGGAGYYWNRERGLKFGSGDFVFSTRLRLWNFNYSKYQVGIWSGHTWFKSRSESNHFSLGLCFQFR